MTARRLTMAVLFYAALYVALFAVVIFRGQLWRYYVCGLVLLGIAASAIQLVPTLELRMCSRC